MINNRLKSILPLMAVIGMLGTACKKELDVNLSNPNGTDPNLAEAFQVMPAALNSTAGRINIGYPFANQWMGYWSRTNSFASTAELETFQLTNGYAPSENLWSGMYKNNYDYNFIIAKAGATSFLGSAASIMKALNAQMLVDTYGNVPYSQSSQPAETIKPQYDSALNIYRALIVQLTDAITTIKASTPAANDATADIMFKGDKTKWVKFANTLKLRILMRQVPKGDQPYVQSQITAISSEGFLGAGEDAQVNPGYADATGQQNPLWAFVGFSPTSSGGGPVENNNYYRANKTMTDLLKSLNDPRIGQFYNKNASGSWDGNYFGEINTARPNTVASSIGPGILQSPTQSALVISSFESLFLQAEAAQRGLTTGNAAALYASAVAENFRYLKVPNAATAAATFLSTATSTDVNFTTSTNKLRTILLQKWISLDGLNGLEAWSEYRRTGIPDRTNPSLNPSTVKNQIPKRLLYPQTEYNLNPGNVGAQNQKATDLFTPIFWGL